MRSAFPQVRENALLRAPSILAILGVSGNFSDELTAFLTTTSAGRSEIAEKKAYSPHCVIHQGLDLRFICIIYMHPSCDHGVLTCCKRNGPSCLSSRKDILMARKAQLGYIACYALAIRPRARNRRSNAANMGTRAAL